jgi:hypothetical protein
MSVKQKAVLEAKREAERFLLRVDELMARHAKDPSLRQYLDIGVGSREMGAVKRASMDLSRALTKLRNPHRGDV